MFWLVSGRPGAGKSLFAARHAADYATQGRRVVANYPITFAKLPGKVGGNLSKCRPVILNGLPSREQLDAIGQGGKTEETAGLLILDEVGVSLGSRSWSAKGREEILGWFSEHRKRKWDVVIICQHVNQIDKQLRVSFADSFVAVRRLDRIKILGLIKLPKMHLAIGKYGLEPGAPVNERWVMRGSSYYSVYDSYSVVAEDTQEGAYSALSKWDLIDRYNKKLSLVNLARQKLASLPGKFALTMLIVEAIVTRRSLEAVASGYGMLKWRKPLTRDCVA